MIPTTMYSAVIVPPLDAVKEFCQPPAEGEEPDHDDDIDDIHDVHAKTSSLEAAVLSDASVKSA